MGTPVKPGGEFPVTAPTPAAPAPVTPTMPIVPPTVAQAGAAAPLVPPPTSGAVFPADCEEHYKILVFPQGEGLTSMNPVTVAAGIETHPQFTFQAPWGTSEVQAVKFAPITQNPAVLHHWILNGPPIGSMGAGGATKFISGWAPGNEGGDLPPDVGMYLPTGNLRLDVHYNNLTGTTTQTDKSGVEICVVKNKANFRKNTAAVIGLTGDSTIPAKATNYGNEMACTAQTTGGPAFLLGTGPHMHKLGVHAYLGLVQGGGARQVLWDGPFDFQDQQFHTFPKMITINSGDSLITKCTYTNPTNQAVTFGENTANEMCFNFSTYYPMGNLTCGFAL
jgi:hypothetical protein